MRFIAGRAAASMGGPAPFAFRSRVAHDPAAFSPGRPSPHVFEKTSIPKEKDNEKHDPESRHLHPHHEPDYCRP